MGWNHSDTTILLIFPCVQQIQDARSSEIDDLRAFPSVNPWQLQPFSLCSTPVLASQLSQYHCAQARALLDGPDFSLGGTWKRFSSLSANTGMSTIISGQIPVKLHPKPTKQTSTHPHPQECGILLSLSLSLYMHKHVPVWTSRKPTLLLIWRWLYSSKCD